MLKITFNEPPNFNRDVDVYFDNRYKLDWFSDSEVIQIVKDIDKSELLPNGSVISPIFGIMPVTKISGGAKALILMLKEDRIIWGTACGDNCSNWIGRISKEKDVTLFFEHPMEFTCELDGICLDTGALIKNNADFLEAWLFHRGYNF